MKTICKPLYCDVLASSFKITTTTKRCSCWRATLFHKPLLVVPVNEAENLLPLFHAYSLCPNLFLVGESKQPKCLQEKGWLSPLGHPTLKAGDPPPRATPKILVRSYINGPHVSIEKCMKSFFRRQDFFSRPRARPMFINLSNIIYLDNVINQQIALFEKHNFKASIQQIDAKV